MEGSPLSVLVATTLDITLAVTVVRNDFLVAKALNAEAIMGLDFLESVINASQGVIHLKEYSKLNAITHRDAYPL